MQEYLHAQTSQNEQLESEMKPSKSLPGATEFINLLEQEGLMEHAQTYKKVVELAEAINQAGGQTLLVGGSVRDMLTNKIPKDFDLEVYRLKPAIIEKVAQNFGKVSDVGKAFGILKVSLSKNVDIDLSLPRTDSKIGTGHRGFEIKSDPNMGIEDAAKRRDFTINSMAADPLTGELFDPFGGAEDLRNKILRVTDEERFRDDPLRVMRALQFVGRMGLSIEPESAKIITSMAPQLKELPKERIFEEWQKLLLKSDLPSLGLSAAMDLGILKELHPEFPPLAETPQEPEWHPEGDVWVHTLMVVDEAAAIIRREQLKAEAALTVILTALCHDLGKPATTQKKDGRIHSHGHEAAGEEPTDKFLKTLGAPNIIRNKVSHLVLNHMAPTALYNNEVVRKHPVSDGAIRKLAERIAPATIYELTLVAEADHFGRGPFPNPEIPEQSLLNPKKYPASEWLLTRARALSVEKSKPVNLIQGRNLAMLGINPGKHMGDIIKLANKLRDEKGLTKENVLSIADQWKTDPGKIIEELEARLE